ncbi:mandelate racemase/muconate lactonizing enzyme family protein [Halorarum halophilum]|uniref:Mandelate racemase/muconate lactonizing enzyme family protein n=1 Tax=Halorarum halophilum TaxID=2743090 RepID=A0A7D5H0U2_9EURY|nr:mandelate racemase/muconate lactonizing enzyme family protein [Halobaculum halophilum]QLG28193.1 mandelate racemase/muconate lactonizing enzyme family protein [Halobaculum halophilum]
MDITDVETVQVQVDLDEPLGVSRGRETDIRSAAFVVVETDAGITGIGEGVGPEPYIVERIVEGKYAPRLIGEDPLDVERLWGAMLTDDLYWDRKGQGVAAASGVDIALWDIAGKYHEEPVYRLLGGDADGSGRLEAYASDLFWDDPDVMADRAAGYVDRGFSAVKTHLGRGVDADEERVAAIRDAIGDAALMVDMNCGYDRADALRVGRMLEEYDVYWYEEPLSPYDVDGLATLRGKLDVPIATGENEYTKWGFRELFEADAVDYAMPDTMRCGGITEEKKVCTLAEAFDVVCSPHCFTTGVGLAATMHVMAASPATKWLEFDTTDFPLFDALFTSSLAVEDGLVSLPEDPGLGVELDGSVVDEYRVE